MQAGTLTYDDLCNFPDDGLRRELIDGELLVSPSPRLRHQQVVGNIFVALTMHVRMAGGGRVFVAPLDVLFSNKDVVEPDVIFVESARADVLTEKNIQGVPSLLVEVVSDSRVDRVRKRDLYERVGVPEYWIADPEADRIEVYRLGADGTYGKPEILEGADVVRCDALPGFEIVAGELFARD